MKWSKIGAGILLLAVISACFFPVFRKSGRSNHSTGIVPSTPVADRIANGDLTPQERYSTEALAELKRLPPLSISSPTKSNLTAYALNDPNSGEGDAAKPGSKIPALRRKIIYTAEVDMVAQDLSKAERELRRWVKAMGGYVAGAEVGGESGSVREGTWTIRIPVSRFDAFVGEVSRLGEVKSTNTQSEDVSEEYYDIGARLRAKRLEEARLLRHLQRTTSLLTDILAVERELSRVHTEIEQMEGRLRFLTNQTDFTTVTVTVHEAKSYTPPVQAAFGTQAGRTWTESVRMLKNAGKSALLAAVALLPWLFAVGLPLAALGLLARRRGWGRAVAHPAPAE